jgi:hypothetical protein
LAERLVLGDPLGVPPGSASGDFESPRGLVDRVRALEALPRPGDVWRPPLSLADQAERKRLGRGYGEAVAAAVAALERA